MRTPLVCGLGLITETLIHPRREDEASSLDVYRRRSWARLLRRIYEVDPLRCPCGGELKIISVLTDPVVVDRILAHRKKNGIKSPFAARAPPAA